MSETYNVAWCKLLSSLSFTFLLFFSLGLVSSIEGLLNMTVKSREPDLFYFISEDYHFSRIAFEQ